MKWDENINWDNPDILKDNSKLWEFLKAKTDDDTFIPLNLNFGNIPKGFIKQFLILTSPKVLVYSALDRIIPAITLHTWSLNFFLLHRIVKETWGGKKYKLPKSPKGTKNSLKSLAIMYKKVLRICQELHTLGFLNEHEAIFFRKVFTEGRLQGNVAPPFGKKYELNKYLRNENALLKSPSCHSIPDSLNKTEFPYTYQFLELSLNLSLKSDPFREEYFIPFLMARGEAIEQQNSAQFVHLESKVIDGKEICYAKIRRGRGGLIQISDKSLN